MVARRRAAAPVVIRSGRRRRIDPSRHGSWKVAYADFVTAMMAFFLLMWLVSATPQYKRQELSDFFRHAGRAAQDAKAGAPPVPSGPLVVPGPGPDTRPLTMRGGGLDFLDTVRVKRATYDHLRQEAAKAQSLAHELQAQAGRPASPVEQSPSSKAAPPESAPLNPGLQRIAADLRDAATSDPALKAQADSIVIDRVGQALRLQMIDQQGFEMFAIGSSVLTPEARAMLARFAPILARVPHGIVITGYTDARPFHSRQVYSNWELSSDRANAARRLLIADGVPEAKIARVAGSGARDLLLPDRPLDPRNRRITFTVLP